MHVLHVTPYFPPTWAYGGIPRIVHGLSRALAKQGVTNSVWTTDALDHRRAQVPPRRSLDGVEVFVSPNRSNRLAYGQQLYAERPVQILHLHGHRHLLNNVAVAFARRHGLPYVFTPNGTLPRHERKVGVKRLWDWFLADAVPRGAARIIAVSRAELGQLRRAGLPPERARQIPNGLSLEEFETLPAPGDFKARWGVKGPMVAYLGQISPRKGVDHLVAAFGGGAIPGATLVIGGNDMGGLAKAKAQDHDGVIFTGLLEGPERLALLVDADVLVYPSTDEVFGLVPFEGLLCGAPVIVGGDCGCGELIAEAGAGLLVRHSDVEGLRERVKALLSDRASAEAMVRRGRRYIEQHLSFERVARDHAALYAEVLDAKREAGGRRETS
ncbi:glycosyltransferase family 4 protein [Myxococcota bacterium]|nr:glycosyltransferase family 4 protein [Myxococcota bacterium]